MLHGPRLKPSTTVRRRSNARFGIFSYHFGQTGARHSLLCLLRTCIRAVKQLPLARLFAMYPVTRVSARLEMPSSRATLETGFDCSERVAASSLHLASRSGDCVTGRKRRQTRHRIKNHSRRKRASPMAFAPASNASRFRRQARFQRGQTPQATPQTRPHATRCESSSGQPQESATSRMMQVTNVRLAIPIMRASWTRPA